MLSLDLLMDFVPMEAPIPWQENIHRPSGLASSLASNDLWRNYSGLFFLNF